MSVASDDPHKIPKNCKLMLSAWEQDTIKRQLVFTLTQTFFIYLFIFLTDYYHNESFFPSQIIWCKMQWESKLTNSALHYNPVDMSASMLLFYLIELWIIDTNASDNKSINTAWKVGSKLFQVGPWSLCWPWQDVGMRAGMTHSLMCYHGNREEQGSCTCVCVRVWIVKRSCLFIRNHFWGFKKKMFLFIFSIDP